MNNNFDNNECFDHPRRPCQRIYCIGPTGATGPTGPEATTFNNYAMVSSNTDTIIDGPGGTFILEDVNTLNGITYDPTTGIFTFTTAGTYLFNWWFNVINLADTTAILSASLYEDSPLSAVIIDSASSTTIATNGTTTLVGSAITSVTENSTYSIQNTSLGNVQLTPNQRASGVITVTRIA